MSLTWKAPGYNGPCTSRSFPTDSEPTTKGTDNVEEGLKDLTLEAARRRAAPGAVYRAPRLPVPVPAPIQKPLEEVPDISDLSITSGTAPNAKSDGSTAERHEMSQSARFRDISGPDRAYDPAGLTLDHSAQTSGGGHSYVSPEINIQDRFELFLLGEGEKKVEETPDTRTANTSIFKFNKEDHTLANLLRAYLLKDPHVNFCGYRVPHPLFANFELRIQTDGDITPKEALNNCCQSIVGELGHLSREFTKEFELRKMVQGEDGTN